MEKRKIKSKVNAGALFEITRIAAENISSPEILERKRQLLLGDISAMVEVQQDPFLIISKDIAEFGAIRRGAIANTLISNSQEAPLNPAELRESLISNDGICNTLLNSPESPLNAYFRQTATAEVIAAVTRGKLPKEFMLAKETRDFIKNGPGEEKEQRIEIVKACFRILSNGTIEFDEKKTQESWTELTSHLENADLTEGFVDPEIAALEEANPELAALDIISHQKPNSYCGVISPMVQPALIVGYFSEPSGVNAPELLAESMGLNARKETTDEAIITLAKGMRDGTLTAEQCNNASAGITQRLLLANFQEKTPQTLLVHMRKFSELNSGIATTEMISEGILELASQMYNSSCLKTAPAHETMVEFIVDQGPDRSEDEDVKRTRLMALDKSKLQGLYLLAISKEPDFAKMIDLDKLAEFSIKLLSDDFTGGEQEARAFKELMHGISGKAIEDVAAYKFYAAADNPQESTQFGIGAILHALHRYNGDVTSYHNSVMALEQQGRYEFSRLYLGPETFVTEKELKRRIAEDSASGKIAVGLIEADPKTAQWLLDQARSRESISLDEVFFKGDLVDPVPEMTRQLLLMNRTLSDSMSVYFSKRIDVIRTLSKTNQSAQNAAEEIEAVMNTGVKQEVMVKIYKEVLGKLYKENPDLYINPETISAENIAANIEKMTYLINTKAEQIVEMFLSQRNSFGVYSANYVYRVVKDQGELDRKVIIYDTVLQSSVFALQPTLDQVVDVILERLPNKKPSKEKLKKEILIAMTDFAAFTQEEMSPAVVELLTPAACMNAHFSYLQILDVRERALDLAMNTQYANTIHTIAKNDKLSDFDVHKSIEKIREKAQRSAVGSAMQDEYKASLVALPQVAEVTNISKSKISKSDKRELDKIGKLLFPDFNKKHRPILARAFVQKNQSKFDVVADHVSELDEAHAILRAQFEGLQSLAERVNTLVNEKFGVTMDNIAPLPVEAESIKGIIKNGDLQMDIPNRSPILSAANQIVQDTEGKGVLSEEAEKMHRKEMPELYATDIEGATRVLEVAKACDENTITISNSNRETSQAIEIVSDVLSHVLPEEIENAESPDELIQIGISRAIEPIIAINRKEEEALLEWAKSLPIIKPAGEFPTTIEGNGNMQMDTVLLISSLLRDEAFGAPEIPLKETDSAFSLNSGNAFTSINDLQTLEAMMAELSRVLDKYEPLEEVVEPEEAPVEGENGEDPATIGAQATIDAIPLDDIPLTPQNKSARKKKKKQADDQGQSPNRRAKKRGRRKHQNLNDLDTDGWF